MAKERVFTYRNVGTADDPVWEKWFQKTVADAVLMSDGDEEEKTIVDYVNAKIDELIGGAPGTYDTLKEIADYIAAHKEVSDALSAAIGGKVDKVAGKGLSTEDFTAALKAKLDALPAITSAQVTAWTNKAEKAVATTSADGLMSKADKARLDGLRGVRYGATAPADMQDGEMFVRVTQ